MQLGLLQRMRKTLVEMALKDQIAVDKVMLITCLVDL